MGCLETLPFPFFPVPEQAFQGRERIQSVFIAVDDHLESSSVANAHDTRPVAITDPGVIDHHLELPGHQLRNEVGCPTIDAALPTIDTVFPGRRLLVQAEHIRQAQSGPADPFPATHAPRVEQLVPPVVLLVQLAPDQFFFMVSSVRFRKEGIEVLARQRPGVAVLVGHGMQDASHDFVFVAAKVHDSLRIVGECELPVKQLVSSAA